MPINIAQRLHGMGTVQKVLLTGSAAVAAALIGTGVAYAATPASAPAPTTSSEVTTGPDTDNIQSGDQTSPDTAVAKNAVATTAVAKTATEPTTGPDTDTVQSGDQSGRTRAAPRPEGRRRPPEPTPTTSSRAASPATRPARTPPDRAPRADVATVEGGGRPPISTRSPPRTPGSRGAPAHRLGGLILSAGFHIVGTCRSATMDVDPSPPREMKRRVRQCGSW